MRLAAALFLSGALAALTGEAGEVPPPVSVLRLEIEGMEEDAEEFPSVRLLSLDSGAAREIPMSGLCEEIEVERGGEYAVSLTDVPAGLMPDREVFLYFSETMNDMEKSITLRPFETRILQKIEGMDLFAEGGILELRDEEDEPVCEFVPDPEGKMLDQDGEEILLQAGRAYVLSQKETAAGYEKGPEMLVLIPEFMEDPAEPLEFIYPLRELPAFEEPYRPAPGEWAAELIVPQPQVIETEAVEKKETDPVREEKKEELLPVSRAVPAYITHTFSTPEETEKKETVSSRRKTGFLVRMTDSAHNYLAGASLAVCDSLGNPVDAWISANEDHLVAGEKVREGETYTIRLIKAAEGYAADTPAIEHVALSTADGRWPVIEMSGHPRAEVKEVTPAQKMKKTADWLVIASALTAALAIGAIIFAALRKPASSVK